MLLDATNGQGVLVKRALNLTWFGSVRPEGCQGPHHPVDPQGPMREYPVREPCPSKCRYPDMRRSHPPCEAPGTTATIWEHQSGGGPAEDGRLNASELSRSVIENRPKVLTGRSQKGTRGGSSVASTDDGDIKPRRTIGRSRPIRLSTADNRVSPTRPVAARRRYPDRKEGDGRGGRGCRRKRRLRCNGRDRAARAGIPNLKGLPAGLSGTMRLDASTDGDVRQRKLNKDGCRKPPVRRNQDRVLRAAGDLFPLRGGLSRVRGNCAP